MGGALPRLRSLPPSSLSFRLVTVTSEWRPRHPTPLVLSVQQAALGLAAGGGTEKGVWLKGVGEGRASSTKEASDGQRMVRRFSLGGGRVDGKATTTPDERGGGDGRPYVRPAPASWIPMGRLGEADDHGNPYL